MNLTLNPVEKIEGQMKVPGDKSISHRALLLAALTEGTVKVDGLLKAKDTLATLDCLKELGIDCTENGSAVEVKGKGLRGFKEPGNVLDAANSGTTARLLTGLLSGQPFHSTITGDASLRGRPMKRVTEPLKMMGAFINGRQNGEHLPLTIRGFDLLPLSYTLPVASAQVKSALLLAALFARGTTEIVDFYRTRDHTERALCHLGAKLEKKGKYNVYLNAPVKLKGDQFKIPGDISAASFFIVAAALAPRGELFIEEVGINPTRTGILDVLREMGADISIHNMREYNCEPVGDLLVKSGRPLRGVEISGEIIPRLIDEIPVLAVAGLYAAGEMVIKGAGDLRLKESDRLRSITLELKKMGAMIKEQPDGLIIQGGAKLRGASCESHNDHRITMALATAALFAESETVISGVETVQVSFPGFFELLNGLVS